LKKNHLNDYLFFNSGLVAFEIAFSKKKRETSKFNSWQKQTEREEKKLLFPFSNATEKKIATKSKQ
jgi:Holliday junction resolvasome RuvABC DNA-binding subunit